MKKVFLGGTCANSTWRNKLIEMLKIDYFNPVVSNWTKEAQLKEEEEKKKADFLLYTITPESHSLYSIAELVQSSNDNPEKTIFCILGPVYVNHKSINFKKDEIKSLWAIRDLIKKNGAYSFDSLEDVASFLNISNNTE